MSIHVPNQGSPSQTTHRTHGTHRTWRKAFGQAWQFMKSWHNFEAVATGLQQVLVLIDALLLHLAIPLGCSCSGVDPRHFASAVHYSTICVVVLAFACKIPMSRTAQGEMSLRPCYCPNLMPRKLPSSKTLRFSIRRSWNTGLWCFLALSALRGKTIWLCSPILQIRQFFGIHMLGQVLTQTAEILVSPVHLIYPCCLQQVPSYCSNHSACSAW